MPASTVDDYFAGLSDDVRPTMEQIRTTVLAAAPNAAEVITYGMPGLRSHGRFLVSYDAYKDHYSLFPGSEGMVETVGEDLRPYLAGRGTIQFPKDEPIPTDLITRVVKFRLDEVAERLRD